MLSNSAQIRRWKKFPLEKTGERKPQRRGSSSRPSRSMLPNDCPDTCVSLVWPGSNHGEQQSRASLREFRSQFSLRRRLMRISSEERLRVTRQT